MHRRDAREARSALAGASSMLALVLLLVSIGRGRVAAAHVEPTVRLDVPRAFVPVTIDGELSDAVWTRAARTRGFRAVDGDESHPYSEALFAWDERNLYVALYAADEDLEAEARSADGPVWLDDDFHMTMVASGREVALDVSAHGVLTDGMRRKDGSTDYGWSSGARVAVDADGTLDDATDRDEEWVAELAVPLSALGLSASGGPIDVRITRWDRTRDRRVQAGTIRARLTLAR